MNPVILEPLAPMKVNVYDLQERLENLLHQLAAARAEHCWASSLESKTCAVQLQSKEFKDHVAALSEMMVAVDKVQELTEQICEIATRLDLAGATPHRKVSVSVETRVRYRHDQAVAWLIANHPELLTFSRREFERLALQERPGFVSFVEVPSAQIDNDLFEYLPAEIKDPLQAATIIP